MPGFPSMRIAELYAFPVTSVSEGLDHGVESKWGEGLPITDAITRQLYRQFHWSWETIYEHLCSSVWPASCIRELLRPNLANVPHKTAKNCLGAPAVISVKGIKSRKAFENLPFSMYQVEVSLVSVVKKAICAYQQESHTILPQFVPGRPEDIVIGNLLIPEPIIRYGTPAAVTAFENRKKKKPAGRRRTAKRNCSAGIMGRSAPSKVASPFRETRKANDNVIVISDNEMPAAGGSEPGGSSKRRKIERTIEISSGEEMWPRRPLRLHHRTTISFGSAKRKSCQGFIGEEVIKLDISKWTHQYLQLYAGSKSGQRRFKKNTRSKNTVKYYEGHLKRAREFIKRYQASEKLREDQCSARAANELFPEDECFEDDDEAALPHTSSSPGLNPDDDEEKWTPNSLYASRAHQGRCTPLAIMLFLWFKCFEGGCKATTADQIVSAFIKYYDELDGDLYRGRWQQQEISNRWVGNPARSGRVQDMLKAIKNSKGEGERKHSQAMSKEAWQQMHQYIDAHLPPRGCSDVGLQTLRAELLQLRALGDLGLTVWMRNCENSNLKAKHFNFSPPPKARFQMVYRYKFFGLNLRNRKGWPGKVAKGEHQLNGHMYNIYQRDDDKTYESVMEYKGMS
ncbi:hypothetical protein BKA70DRAFT_1521328 [Coprinopsis sp. MPI-PUGE-AT-0042]|nr:hypothetical protein BKA70DRAFT_1521328 [Coprinopsis sp. MPI-PUGE-AT-0042]